MGSKNLFLTTLYAPRPDESQGAPSLSPLGNSKTRGHRGIYQHSCMPQKRADDRTCFCPVCRGSGAVAASVASPTIHGRRRQRWRSSRQACVAPTPRRRTCPPSSPSPLPVGRRRPTTRHTARTARICHRSARRPRLRRLPGTFRPNPA
jgi:hypothetical protein